MIGIVLRYLGMINQEFLRWEWIPIEEEEDEDVNEKDNDLDNERKPSEVDKCKEKKKTTLLQRYRKFLIKKEKERIEKEREERNKGIREKEEKEREEQNKEKSIDEKQDLKEKKVIAQKILTEEGKTEKKSVEEKKFIEEKKTMGKKKIAEEKKLVKDKKSTTKENIIEGNKRIEENKTTDENLNGDLMMFEDSYFNLLYTLQFGDDEEIQILLMNHLKSSVSNYEKEEAKTKNPRNEKKIDDNEQIAKVDFIESNTVQVELKHLEEKSDEEDFHNGEELIYPEIEELCEKILCVDKEGTKLHDDVHV